MKKRVFAAAAALLLALSLTACGSSDTASSGSKKSVARLYRYKFDHYVTLGEYRGLTVDRNSDAYKAANAAYTNRLLENAGLTSTAERAAGEAIENGDVLHIDYTGKRDGVAFEGGTAQNAELTIGSHQFIDGFETGLIGKKVGETVDLNLNFPDPYPNNPDLAGAPVVFTVTVRSAVKTVYPALTAEIAKQLSFDSLEALQKQADESALDTVLWEQVTANAEILKYPDEELNDQVQLVINQYVAYAKGYDMTLEDFLAANGGMTMQDFRAVVQEQYKPTVAEDLICYAIADAEGIVFTKEDKEAEVARLTAESGQTDAQLRESYGENYAETTWMLRTVRDFVRENATIK